MCVICPQVVFQLKFCFIDTMKSRLKQPLACYSLSLLTNYKSIWSDYLLFPNKFSIFFTIMMSRLQKLFIQSLFGSIKSTQSRCCEIKTTCSFKTCNMQPFYKRFSSFHRNIFVPNVSNQGTLPEIQDKHFISRF